MTDTDQRKAFLALAARYCQLGRLLPAIDSLDLDDAAAVAEAKLILREMSQTKSAMDELLVESRESPAG